MTHLLSAVQILGLAALVFYAHSLLWDYRTHPFRRWGRRLSFIEASWNWRLLRFVSPTELVSEAELLPPGSLADENLTKAVRSLANSAAGAKRNEQLPLETPVRPYLSKAPQGEPGRRTWEELWVFQAEPKTAVRLTFTENGKGGTEFAIRTT